MFNGTNLLYIERSNFWILRILCPFLSNYFILNYTITDNSFIFYLGRTIVTLHYLTLCIILYIFYNSGLAYIVLETELK